MNTYFRGLRDGFKGGARFGKNLEDKVYAKGVWTGWRIAKLWKEVKHVHTSKG